MQVNNTTEVSAFSNCSSVDALDFLCGPDEWQTAAMAACIEESPFCAAYQPILFVMGISRLKSVVFQIMLLLIILFSTLEVQVEVANEFDDITSEPDL